MGQKPEVGVAQSGQKGPSIPTIDGPLPISVKGEDLIIRFETGGKSYYTRFYERPQNPGFSSGVTVGFGYDLKFHSPAEISRDWSNFVSASEVRAMQSVSGLDGNAFRRIRNKVRVPWAVAAAQFRAVILPRWMQRTKTAFDLEDGFHPHRAGALTSLVFNRGPSMRNIPSRREMRNIRSHVAQGRHDLVPAEFQSMRRLWPNHTGTNGLQTRRTEEGKLYAMAAGD